jgi:hypothetical protein
MSLATTAGGALDYSLYRKHELLDLGEELPSEDRPARESIKKIMHAMTCNIFESSTTPVEDAVDEDGHVQDLSSKADLLANHVWLLKEVSCKIACANGGLVLFKSAADEDIGRRTVLRLLSSALLPTVGAFYMAPHRTCIMVDRSPSFIEGTILRNLRLGRCQAWETGIGKDTSTTKKAIDLPKDALVPDCGDLLEICRDTARACGLRECFLLDLGMNLGGPGLESLNKHDVVALCLARTFLGEPDIVLIDHLGDGLGSAYLEKTMLPLLRKYVWGGLRGVLQAPSTRQLPRPPRFKPVVMWSSSILPAQVSPQADMVVTLADRQLCTNKLPLRSDSKMSTVSFQ